MANEINYKGNPYYNTAKLPIRQPLFFTGLIQLLSKIMLTGKEHRVEKIGMEDLKPPYMMLSNHMSFVDFELASLGTYPARVNNVVNIDGYYMRPWLMEWIGAICTRKYTTDIHLVRSIRKVFERGDVLGMYPEARYTPDGTTSLIPDSVGMLVKRSRVPVVAVVHHGNYLHAPFWCYRKKRKVPLYTTLTKILTTEELDALSVAEINERIRNALSYDEYRYQKDNGIRITEPFRAEGMHKILYKCPACKTDYSMTSSGITISCKSCGKVWEQDELGELHAKDGVTEVSHVPDWFKWQRDEVRGEIERGEYSFEDEIDVYSMPGCYKFVPIGKARLTHNGKDGFIIEGTYRGEPYRIQRTPLQSIALHTEYEFPHVKPFDCIDISTEKDSFYCYPTKENVITKLSLATEEIYKIRHKEAQNGAVR